MCGGNYFLTVDDGTNYFMTVDDGTLWQEEDWIGTDGQSHLNIY